jgi:hypothetical protein
VSQANGWCLARDAPGTSRVIGNDVSPGTLRDRSPARHFAALLAIYSPPGRRIRSTCVLDTRSQQILRSL